MAGIAVTTRGAGEMVISPPYVDETLSFGFRTIAGPISLTLTYWTKVQ
jgi:hypothetical protein